MKISHDFSELWSEAPGLRRWSENAALAVAIFVAFLALAGSASGQVSESANRGGLTIAAGATGSGFELQFGDRKMLGITGFVDVDSRRRLGLEAEGRWLEFHQTANVHAETYSVGPRYHMSFGRFQPYAKGLIGFGDFNFPFNGGHGSYLVVTGGGGVDYRLNRRISIRAADFEYQSWPQFTYGAASSIAMSSVGVSAGIRVRVF